MSEHNLQATFRTGHWPTLAGAWLHLTVSFMVWLLFGALAIAMGDALRLTATQLSVLVALPLLGGAFLRIAAGWACDWYGAKRAGLLVLGLQLIAVFWAVFGGTTYGELVGIALLLGAGGASFAVAMPVASRAYPAAHQGLVLGLVASGNIGTVVILFLAPRWEAILGWHGACAVMLFPLVLTFGLFAGVVREEPVARPRARGAWWRVARNMMRLPSVYWLCLIYGITFGGFVGLTSFLPLLLHEHYGSDPIVGGSLAALCGLTGSLIRPVGGYAADRWGGLRILAGLLALLAVMSILAAFLPALAWAVVVLVLLVAVMGFGNGVIFQIVSEWFPRDIGLASGLVGAAGGIGGFLVPIWFGLLRERTGTFMSGFIGLALISAAAATTVTPAVKYRLRKLAQASNAGGFSR